MGCASDNRASSCSVELLTGIFNMDFVLHAGEVHVACQTWHTLSFELSR
jgi:hypothetical protein